MAKKKSNMAVSRLRALVGTAGRTGKKLGKALVKKYKEYASNAGKGAEKQLEILTKNKSFRDNMRGRDK